MADPPPAAPSPRLPAGFWPMIASTASFAVMNLFVKYAARIPAHEQILVRAMVTLVVIGAILGVRGQSPWGKNHRILIARGFTGFVALLAYFETLRILPLPTAVTFQHLSPIFTILLSGVMLGEPPRWIQVPFFLVAIAGVAVLRGFSPELSAWGLALGIGSAVFSGLAYNFIRMLRDTDPPLVVVFWFPLVSVVVVGPWTALDYVVPTPIEAFHLLMVGLFTTLGQVFLSMAYQRSRAREVSSLNYLGVIYASFFGYALFGEVLSAGAWIGLGLVVVGVIAGTRYGR